MRRLVYPIVLGLAAPAHAEPSSAAPPRVAAQVPTDEELIAEAMAADELATETIVVDDVAPESDAPSAGVRVVGARALELTPGKNADDLLRVVPGLYLSQHGSEGKGQQFFLRGFDAVHGADLALRVGGVLVNEQSNVHGQGYADLGFVIPEVVAGLVARKGPFDLEQGWFATAGSVDLELGAVERGRRASYELGTTNRHRVLVVDAPAGGPTAEVLAAEVMHDDGHGDGRQSQKGAVLGQTEVTLGRARVRPLLAAHWGRFGEPGVIAREDLDSGQFTRDSAPAGDLDGSASRVLAGVGVDWRAGRSSVRLTSHLGWRQMRLAENFTGWLVSPEHGDARDQRHRAVDGSVRAVARRRLSSGVSLLGGAEVTHAALMQAEDRVTPTGEVWRSERALDATVTTGGAWTGTELRRGSWTVTGGGRVDAIAVKADDVLAPERSGRGMVAALSPRLVVAWRVPAGSLAVSAGRGVRPPEARAFTRRPSRENEEAVVYDGGDPEITAASAVELGGERRWSQLTLGAAGFATWIDRESIFDHVSGTSVALDGSRRLGAEAFVELRPLEGVTARADVTAVDARFVVTGNPVPGAPRLLAGAELRLDRAPWSAGLAGRFLGARPLSHGAIAGGSAVVDALAGWTRGAVTLEAQVDNLLASEWNEGEYHFASQWDRQQPASNLPRVHISPGRPFGVRGGVTVRF